MPAMARYLHTMYRISEPERSRRFYEALGFTFAGDFDIVRDGQLEATNYFFSIGDQESVLELTFNHDGRSYELGTGYGHIAVAWTISTGRWAGSPVRASSPSGRRTRSARAARASASCKTRTATGSS
jgi:catechol 2,3-dioxygenase-like lactoylglutathione lyase family enzyme